MEVVKVYVEKYNPISLGAFLYFDYSFQQRVYSY